MKVCRKITLISSIGIDFVGIAFRTEIGPTDNAGLRLSPSAAKGYGVVQDVAIISNLLSVAFWGNPWMPIWSSSIDMLRTRYDDKKMKARHRLTRHVPRRFLPGRGRCLPVFGYFSIKKGTFRHVWRLLSSRYINLLGG